MLMTKTFGGCDQLTVLDDFLGYKKMVFELDPCLCGRQFCLALPLHFPDVTGKDASAPSDDDQQMLTS